MRLFLFALCLGFSNAFRLPKIFKSGMVLQAHPTDAVIWGFLDGNTNPVDISGDCSIKGEKFTFTKTYFPTKVIFDYVKAHSSTILILNNSNANKCQC